MYRYSTHPSTGLSLYELMFGRAARTILPQLKDIDNNYDIVSQHDTKKKETMKVYADNKRNALISEIKIGDKVYMKQTKSTNWLHLSAVNHTRSFKGNMLAVCDDDKS